MREIRPYGSEGGGAEANRFSLPLSPILALDILDIVPELRVGLELML